MATLPKFIEALKEAGVSQDTIKKIHSAASTKGGEDLIDRLKLEGDVVKAGEIKLADYVAEAAAAVKSESGLNAVLTDLVTNTHVEKDIATLAAKTKQVDGKEVAVHAPEAVSKAKDALVDFRADAFKLFQKQEELSGSLAKVDANLVAENMFHKKFSAKMPDSKYELRQDLRDLSKKTRELARRVERDPGLAQRLQHAEAVEARYGELVNSFESTLRDAGVYERAIDRLGKKIGEAQKEFDVKLLDRADEDLYKLVDNAGKAQDKLVRASEDLAKLVPTELEHSEVITGIKEAGKVSAAAESTGRFSNKFTAKEAEKVTAKAAETTKAAEGTLKTLFKNPVVKYGGIAAGLLIGAKLLGAFDSKEQSAAR